MYLVCNKTTEFGSESFPPDLQVHQMEKTAVIKNKDYTPNMLGTTLVLIRTDWEGRVNLYAASKGVFTISMCLDLHTKHPALLKKI